MSRRAVMAAGGVAAAVSAAVAAAGWPGMGGQWPARPEPPAEPVADAEPLLPAEPLPPSGPVSHLAVIAHPDDDLFFFNPDVRNAISAGHQVTTVCLTAGDGRPPPSTPDGGPGGPGKIEYYVAARANGLRAAYATMATGSRDAAWTTTPMTLRGGAVAEVSRLLEAPQVTLIFLNVSIGGYLEQGRTLLGRLWDGAVPARPTIRPAGSPVPGVYSYSRAQVVDVLADLLAQYRPTVVRTMDPDPEHLDPETKRRWATDSGDFCDNEDHTATARFTWEALRRYAATPDGRTVAVQSYLGYAVARWPQNLGQRVVREKLALLSVYGGVEHENDRGKGGGRAPGHGRDHDHDHDHSQDKAHHGHACGRGGAAECGDRGVGGNAAATRWAQSLDHRYPGGTDWLRLGPDGRLTAFAVLGGRALMWRETKPGSRAFAGPSEVGAGSLPAGSVLTPNLTVAEGRDGRRHLFALRLDTAPPLTPDAPPAAKPARTSTAATAAPAAMTPTGSAPGTARLVTAVQNPGRADFGPWTDLGAPAPTGKSGSLGVPVAIAGADGLMRLYIRDGAKALSHRAEAAPGEWGPWTSLGGTHLYDAPVAAISTTGQVDVYAATRDGVMRWSEPAPGAAPVPADLGIPSPAGAVSVVQEADRRFRLVTRQRQTGAMISHTQTARGAGSAWDPSPETLSTAEGNGLIAVAALRDGLVLAQLGDHGRVCVATRPNGSRDPLRWQAIGPYAVHTPAAAVLPDGRVMIAVIGADGALFTEVRGT